MILIAFQAGRWAGTSVNGVRLCSRSKVRATERGNLENHSETWRQSVFQHYQSSECHVFH